MNIIRSIQRKGNRVISTKLEWDFNDKHIMLSFPFDADFLFSESTRTVVIELYEIGKLQVFDEEGVLSREFDIPKLPGYHFRGININKVSQSGITLLYCPTSDEVGNEWGDIEQYEFNLSGNDPLGKKLGIFR